MDVVCPEGRDLRDETTGRTRKGWTGRAAERPPVSHPPAGQGENYFSAMAFCAADRMNA